MWVEYNIGYGSNFQSFVRETLTTSLHERIASLHGTRFLAYWVNRSRLLRSMRLVIHLVRRINQRVLRAKTDFIIYISKRLLERAGSAFNIQLATGSFHCRKRVKMNIKLTMNLLSIVIVMTLLSGCWTVAAVGAGAYGGYQMKKEGYTLQNPVTKEEKKTTQ